jgi:hypothetical protein
MRTEVFTRPGIEPAGELGMARLEKGPVQIRAIGHA